MPIVLIIIIWLITGAISYILISTQHWLAGTILIIILLLATRVGEKET